MTNIVIVGAARTAVGSFNGAFANTPAHELGATAVKAALERAKVDGRKWTRSSSARSSPPARARTRPARPPWRRASRRRRPPGGSTSSAARACARWRIGLQQIANGDANIIVAGGQESMSLAPHAAHMRSGTKMGDLKLVDTMLKDGLMDAFNGYHMGTTAENVAQRWQLTREEQDQFAAASQNKAEAAQKEGRFKDEIVPFTITTRKGDVVVDQDEYIRAGTTVEALAKLKPAFSKDGTVTAGNASGINDGAAALVLMTEAEAAEARPDAARPHRLLGHGRRRSGDHGHGPDPGLPQGAGEGRLEGLRTSISSRPTRPSRPRRSRSTRTWAGIPSIVNVNGGAIAIGHPIGASGARVLVTLLHEMGRRDAKKGLATLCIGGGMGVAMCLER